jgi:aminoglycoside phosphotransferase (APT) family kinase protein
LNEEAAADPLARDLAGWLGAQLHRDGIDATNVTCTFAGPVPTGNSNVTMPFQATWSGPEPESLDLVLRMQVPANQIFLDADVLREYRVLAGLIDEAVPTPRPRWSEANSAVLGQPFFVMDCVAGTVPTGAPSIHAAGWLADRSPAQRRVAWDSATAAVAAVSQVNWQSNVPFLAAGAYGTTLASRMQHVSDWYRWVVGNRTYPVTDAALAYLLAEMPREVDPPVLCWGDARMGNLMFDTNHQVAAVLDWELASIGPPGIDLGWWLTFDEFTTQAHHVQRLPGYPDRQQTIERHEALTGRHIANLLWYEIYCAWVLTVTVIRMADIGVTAQRLPADNRMGEGNLTAQMLARWLDLEVPSLDPHYAARRGLPLQ